MQIEWRNKFFVAPTSCEWTGRKRTTTCRKLSCTFYSRRSYIYTLFDVDCCHSVIRTDRERSTAVIPALRSNGHRAFVFPHMIRKKIRDPERHSSLSSSRVYSFFPRGFFFGTHATSGVDCCHAAIRADRERRIAVIRDLRSN